MNIVIKNTDCHNRKIVELEKLQQKLGEVLGLEMAAQKAVEELGSKGLLDVKGMLAQLEKMQS
jgi:hypothetical protein